LLKDKNVSSALIFCRTKNGANRLTKKLLNQSYKTEVIHGNKSQNARTAALKSFKAHESRILIATDIAARGLDISQISHVFNYDMPLTPETYLHRMGRTGRAGEVGETISFCSREELSLLKDVQKHIAMEIPVLKSPIIFSKNEITENKSTPQKTNSPAKPQTSNSNQRHNGRSVDNSRFHHSPRRQHSPKQIQKANSNNR
ncbi:MAG: ATP-dependent helicase, partial [Erysipelotrichia bacterium]|nr:ATP-dependent helicase [Erysipelotrichia bacterium]